MEMQGIRTDADLVAFLIDVDYFHDSIIRECYLVSDGFVDTEFRMHGDARPFDARVFIQTQSADVPGIEIEFGGVSRFCIDQIVELRPVGTVEDGKVRFSFVGSHGKEPQVLASAMWYRTLDAGCLGNVSVFHNESLFARKQREL